MKAKVITKTEITSIETGDIFQFTESSGCHKLGALLVVIKSGSRHNPHDLEFAHVPRVSGSFGNYEFIQEEFNAGRLRFAGTVECPDVQIVGFGV